MNKDIDRRVVNQTPDIGDYTKSTYSPHGGLCVGVANVEGHFWVTNTKFPNNPTVKFSRGKWEAFIKGAKDGEFDFDLI